MLHIFCYVCAHTYILLSFFPPFCHNTYVYVPKSRNEKHRQMAGDLCWWLIIVSQIDGSSDEKSATAVSVAVATTAGVSDEENESDKFTGARPGSLRLLIEFIVSASCTSEQTSKRVSEKKREREREVCVRERERESEGASEKSVRPFEIGEIVESRETWRLFLLYETETSFSARNRKTFQHMLVLIIYRGEITHLCYEGRDTPTRVRVHLDPQHASTAQHSLRRRDLRRAWG